jgi:hypothetical protein
MRFNIDVSDFRRANGQWQAFSTLFPGGINEAMESIGKFMEQELIGNTPVSDVTSRDGHEHAYKQWVVKMTESAYRGRATVEVTNNAYWLEYVISGSSGYVPKSVDKRYLLYRDQAPDTVAIYGNMFTNPGFPANDFIKEVFDAKRWDLVDEVGSKIRTDLQRTIS